MALPSPLPDPLVSLIAGRFHLLAEPTRIRLFDRLRDGEATVHELAVELETSQQNVSKHLSLLADAGVLARRKDGNRVHYRIADSEIADLCDRVSRSIEQRLPRAGALLNTATKE